MSISFTAKAAMGGLAAAMLFLAHGANSATISRGDQYPFYGPGLVQYVASKGSFPAVIVANPFGAKTDRALLAKIELPGAYPPTAFSLTTAKNRDDGYLVLVFNPIQGSSGRGACAAPTHQAASTKAGPTDPLRLQIAFCYGREVVSEAFMEMPRPAGPGDQSFRLAMARLLDTLLPIDSRDGGGCQNPRATSC